MAFGRWWSKLDDRTRGLPSTFGFPIRIHPRDPNTTWTMPLNGDMADVSHPTQLQRSGDHAMADKTGRRCAKVCRRQAVSSLCSVKQWRVTNAIQPESISAQIVARSSQASMKVRIGRRSHVTCQLYSRSRYSNENNSWRLSGSFPLRLRLLFRLRLSAGGEIETFQHIGQTHPLGL